MARCGRDRSSLAGSKKRPLARTAARTPTDPRIGQAPATLPSSSLYGWFFVAVLALPGTARSFGQLSLYRVCVGVGEATLSPSAYWLIAGYFPPQRLALAIGVFSAGVRAGTGIAFLLGGAPTAWCSSAAGPPRSRPSR